MLINWHQWAVAHRKGTHTMKIPHDQWPRGNSAGPQHPTVTELHWRDLDDARTLVMALAKVCYWAGSTEGYQALCHAATHLYCAMEQLKGGRP